MGASTLIVILESRTGRRGHHDGHVSTLTFLDPRAAETASASSRPRPVSAALIWAASPLAYCCALARTRHCTPLSPTLGPRTMSTTTLSLSHVIPGLPGSSFGGLFVAA